MTEEEKKAVEIVKKFNEENRYRDCGIINNAIDTLINLVVKQQKELEQEKEKNKEYERILDIWDNRKYRKRYLEERRKEQPNLLYPDADEIYQKYYEEKSKNEKEKKYRDLYMQSLADNLNQNLKNKEKSNEQLEALNEGWKLEIERKDKIIDLMAKKFSEIVCFAPLNQKCNQGDKNFDKSKCIECIKQYFEKKAEESDNK